MKVQRYRDHIAKQHSDVANEAETEAVQATQNVIPSAKPIIAVNIVFTISASRVCLG